MLRFMYLLVLATFLVCGCGGKSEVGQTYDNLDSLIGDQAERGYVKLGLFHEAWPATVKNVQTAMNEIEFKLKDGGPQKYPGYTGYELKVIRMETKEGKETVAVFRSEKKQ
jgi:hypothetical protein